MELPINQILQGDCLEIMREFPDKSVDLVLTDPPYNAKNIGPNARVYEGQMMQVPQEEYIAFCQNWFREAERVGKNILFTPGIGNMCYYPQPTWAICWHKPAAVSFNRMGGFNAWEPIFFYGKMPKGKHIGQDYKRQDTFNLMPGIEKGHPCPKPLPLIKWLVEKFTNENDIVLDPFLGSGTTTTAAKQLGRKYIGIDIILTYCQMSEACLRQEVLF